MPLTPEQEAYYKGWEAAYRQQLKNCWTPVENCVLNVYTQLEDVARKSIAEIDGTDASKYISTDELRKVLADVDKLRELNRGMWARDLKQ